ncbi:unnamed protein product [Owenia fusiformis]|uniref:Uncharacterized protein n=1 Tax=Owenia fusiformis TaxID=6347 RepID=A0A8J1T5I4_OWEFU|nr:unnamed protein product [Owenia fusiformis]
MAADVDVERREQTTKIGYKKFKDLGNTSRDTWIRTLLVEKEERAKSSKKSREESFMKDPTQLDRLKNSPYANSVTLPHIEKRNEAYARLANYNMNYERPIPPKKPKDPNDPNQKPERVKSAVHFPRLKPKPKSHTSHSTPKYARGRSMKAKSSKYHRKDPSSGIVPRLLVVQVEKKAHITAERAIKNHKIFQIDAPYPVDRYVRASLRRRGWVEKFHKAEVGGFKFISGYDSDDEQKVVYGAEEYEVSIDQNGIMPWEEENGLYAITSRLVRHKISDFIWSGAAYINNHYNTFSEDQIVNHFVKGRSFSTKSSLVSVLDDLIWYAPTNADTFFPRCFLLNDEGKDAFIDNFRLTTCSAILRHIVEKYYNKKGDSTGSQPSLKRERTEIVCREEKDDSNEPITSCFDATPRVQSQNSSVNIINHTEQSDNDEPNENIESQKEDKDELKDVGKDNNNKDAQNLKQSDNDTDESEHSKKESHTTEQSESKENKANDSDNCNEKPDTDGDKNKGDTTEDCDTEPVVINADTGTTNDKQNDSSDTKNNDSKPAQNESDENKENKDNNNDEKINEKNAINAESKKSERTENGGGDADVNAKENYIIRKKPVKEDIDKTNNSPSKGNKPSNPKLNVYLQNSKNGKSPKSNSKQPHPPKTPVGERRRENSVTLMTPYGKVKDDSKKKSPEVPVKAVELALQYVQQFLQSLQHEDIDDQTKSFTDKEWESLLKWHQNLNHENGKVAITESLLEDSEKALKQLQKKSPQYAIDGCKNLWIVKPADKSKGIGIEVHDKLDDITKFISNSTLQGNYVAQKYIERPFLVYNTKFDIRQWFLVTDWNPLTVWFYRDSYLRICSQEFSLENMHEAIHLSNVAIQQFYENGPRHADLPEDNFWSHKDFSTYLKATGHEGKWEKTVYPGMKNAILCCLLSTQDIPEHRKNAFELYGADFMLSEDCSPWLIEINASPGMSAGSMNKNKLCAQVIEDAIKVVLDQTDDDTDDTGGFELIYRNQFVPNPRCTDVTLSVEGKRIKKNKSCVPTDWLNNEELAACKENLKKGKNEKPVEKPEWKS